MSDFLMPMLNTSSGRPSGPHEIDLRVSVADDVHMSGFVIGLHPARHGQLAPANDALSIALEVDDIDAAVQELGGQGVSFPKGVKDDGAVKLAMFADPDGYPLYLCQVMHGANA